MMNHAVRAYWRHLRMRRLGLWLALVFVGSGIIYSVGLGRGFTVDEYTTWQATRLPLPELIANRLRAGHSPVYFVFESWWVRVFGDAEWVMRVPSVLFAAGSVVLLFLFLRSLLGNSVANYALPLLLTHQLAVTCAHSARPYAGALFFSIALGFTLSQWWRDGKLRMLFYLFATTLLGLLFYPAFGLSVAAMAVACLTAIPCNKRKATWGLLTLLLAVLVLAVPTLLLAKSQQRFSLQGFSWSFERPINLLARTVFGDYKLVFRGATRYLVLVVWGWLLFRAFWTLRSSVMFRSIASDFPISRFLTSWVFVPPLALNLFEAVTHRNVLSHPRYLLPSLGGIIVLHAVAFASCQIQPQAKRDGWNKWLRLMPFLMVTFQLIVTLGWLRTNGDGPHELAPQLLRINARAPVIGMTHPLSYEWRNLEHRPPLIPAYQLSVEEFQELIHKAAPDGIFWVFVYDNNMNSLDTHVRENLPRGLQCAQRLSVEDARAYLITPRSTQID